MPIYWRSASRHKTYTARIKVVCNWYRQIRQGMGGIFTAKCALNLLRDTDVLHCARMSLVVSELYGSSERNAGLVETFTPTAHHGSSAWC